MTVAGVHIGLTRIRPNNCAFKDAFFGSIPLEFNSGAVKIGGHARDFTECAEAKQPETTRSGASTTVLLLDGAKQRGTAGRLRIGRRVVRRLLSIGSLDC